MKDFSFIICMLKCTLFAGFSATWFLMCVKPFPKGDIGRRPALKRANFTLAKAGLASERALCNPIATRPAGGFPQ